MGSYTQIATEGARAAARRRSLRIDAPHVGGERDATPFTYECPECTEGSMVLTTCLRCDVELRPTGKSVSLTRPSDAEDATENSLGPIALGMGVISGVPGFLWASATIVDNNLDYGRHAADWSQAVGVLFFALLVPLMVVGPIAIFRWVDRIVRRRRRRRDHREARAEADALAAISPTKAPDSADTAVRVVGRVEVDDGALSVTDGTTRVRVPLAEDVHAMAGDGPRYVLTEGEEVEVVGVGARILGAGDGYRDTRGEFEFSSTHPIRIYVR